MSEGRIGRVVVASLHQAIADLLPSRLEFYENWLNAVGLRQGTIGLAALNAVLSFLRHEDVYVLVTTRAGEYAAEWTFAELSPIKRAFVWALPVTFRTRATLRMARAMIRGAYPGSRALVKMRSNGALLSIRGSLFCQVREAATDPLCWFYAAAVGRLLRLFQIQGEAQVTSCRAIGAAACQVSVQVHRGKRTDEPLAA
ncbi:MAG: hypothetical protein HYX76_09995 [Acidobacteria bacterium]|nr:hypothetical protein [Acidobacteriota bacterium]